MTAIEKTDSIIFPVNAANANSSSLSGILSEVFSSFQGEGGSVPGSCLGKRQIFVRLSGCNLRCVWCDTPEALSFQNETCRIEQSPGKRDFRYVKNPLPVDDLFEACVKLTTRDLHSISFTGGEPLCQTDLCKGIGEKLLASGYTLFLETAAALPREAWKLRLLFDYVSADLKDESAHAARDWRRLVELELETMKIFVDEGKHVYAKVVVTSETKEENMEWYAQELSRLNVPLVIQVVTPFGSIKEKPGWKLLASLSEAAARYMRPDQICIGYQMHQSLGIL